MRDVIGRQPTELGQGDDTDDLVAVGGFEACAAYAADHHDGPCAECGWLADDHVEATLAVVIRVPTRIRTPLRRAS